MALSVSTVVYCRSLVNDQAQMTKRNRRRFLAQRWFVLVLLSARSGGHIKRAALDLVALQ